MDLVKVDEKMEMGEDQLDVSKDFREGQKWTFLKSTRSTKNSLDQSASSANLMQLSICVKTTKIDVQRCSMSIFNEPGRFWLRKNLQL